MVVPLSGTDVRVLTGVQFTKDYTHTRWFDNISEQTTHFLARPRLQSLAQVTFQRMNGKSYFVSNASIEELYGANYIMFRNPSTHSNKWIYAFVTEIEYVRKNVTNVHFELDVLQTWMFEMNFRPSYIIREHSDLYKSDGSPYINTEDEGLNYGTEYDIVNATHHNSPSDLFYLVIVTKSLLHEEDGAETNSIHATNIGLPQPLCYYIHPFRKNGDSPNVSIGSSSVDLTSLTDVLSSIYSQEDAVNNIVSLYVTEHIGYTPDGGGGFTFDDTMFSKASIADDVNQNIETIYVKDLKQFNSYVINCGPKYEGFKPVEESKLLMYPYCVTLITDFKGNQFEVKNEYIDSENLNVSVRGSLGTSNKVAYSVAAYNTGQSGLSNDEKLQISLGSGFLNTNPQDVPIITDLLSAYLQGNRNSIENQQNSILFNGLLNTVGGAVSGATNGGAIGAIGGSVSGLGNTVLQIQSIQAKQSDISNTPPQLQQMGGNITFDFGNDYTGFYVIKKQIKNEYIKKLNDFFMMYGYKINEVKTPNLHTRRSYNYIQTLSCNITGDFNSEALVKIKSIFDNGITLWHVNEIGRYDLPNEVI